MFGVLSLTLSIICTKSSNLEYVAAGFLNTYPARTAGEAGCFISTHMHEGAREGGRGGEREREREFYEFKLQWR